MSTVTRSWLDANQQYLMTAIGAVRQELEKYKASLNKRGDHKKTASFDPSCIPKQLKNIAACMPAPAAIDTLTEMFGLSPFERKVLLICAGMELDASFSASCASENVDRTRPYPTFSLVLAALPDAHWSSLTPSAPLRYWRLIEIGPGELLTQSPLRIDERILHYLAGVQNLDERLSGIMEPIHAGSELVPSQRMVVDRMASLWANRSASSGLPVLNLCGDDLSGKHAVAVATCATVGMHLHKLSASAIPLAPADFESLTRLWEREAALSRSALLLECDELDGSDTAHASAAMRFCERVRGFVMLSSSTHATPIERPLVIFDVARPTSEEQHALWIEALEIPTESWNGKIKSIIGQFNLTAGAICSVSKAFHVKQLEDGNEKVDEPSETMAVLWHLCRSHTRPRLDNLAQRIEPAALWDDIVLPQQQKQTLREIAMHVRHRNKVYKDWDFSSKGLRNLGISALFVGESGTGKTMAAEVIANELSLDLYRVDLSQVVSKYIGESEKNLKRVFDAAEDGGAILLFDEADALFGKRSEVRDSHDRYANIEVSYLLQRMEAYRGLAILTTNMKQALDIAFLRRVRFVVKFPFPDATQRAEIWQRIFPSEMPMESLDIERLSRLTITGGSIRNIVVNAAFLAADDDAPVRMGHLFHAAKSEYAKLDKPLSAGELG